MAELLAGPTLVAVLVAAELVAVLLAPPMLEPPPVLPPPPLLELEELDVEASGCGSQATTQSAAQASMGKRMTESFCGQREDANVASPPVETQSQTASHMCCGETAQPG